MRLKSIKLAGFKSFVDPTTVNFPSNMAAVVGPNGCGKSNIIDAVRWVMGESSAKNLRGESMTDVIFNGSNPRKPVSQASIELIFDNAETTLVGEYAQYAEISIRRRVSRDGQNTYFLNGTKCRRRDITDIFLGTGLGPRSYSIIEQGMISKLIEARPEDLRNFIEEAAGISKYKERRRETESRIRRTQENLARLTDLREELGRQLERLHRQAQSAEKYQEHKAEERQLKAQLGAVRWRDLNEQVGQRERVIGDQEVAFEALVAEQRGADAGIERLRDGHHELSERFNQVQARFYSVGGDIARVELGSNQYALRSLLNNKPAVAIPIFQRPGSNAIEISNLVREKMAELKHSFPQGMDYSIVYDPTIFVRGSIEAVVHTLFEALVLVVLVVILFLQTWRASIIPLAAVPVSLIGTFAVMYLCDFSLNNLSLMALIIATGFVVDDAIVVVENIARRIEEGDPPIEAAITGARQVGFTVLSMTLSLVAVFIPLLLMGGLTGRLFREFAVTLSAAILVSLVVSLTLTPMLCARLLRPLKRPEGASLARRSDRFFAAFMLRYRASLGWALEHSRLMVAIMLACIAMNLWLFVVVPKGFLPQQDSGRLRGYAVADQSISFQSLSAKMGEYRKILSSDPAVENVVGFIGGGRWQSSNTGSFFVTLKPIGERDPVEKVLTRLRERIAKVPGAALYLNAGQDVRLGGRDSNAQYEFTLRSDDLTLLREWAPKVEAAMRKLPQLVDVNSDSQDKGVQTRLVIDRDRAATLGINVEMVDAVLNDSFGQRQVSTIFNPLNQYRVVMEVDQQYQQSPEILRQVQVIGNDGQRVPLSAFSHYEPSRAPLEVNHQGQFAATTLSFNLAPGAQIGPTREAIMQALEPLHIPVDVQTSFEGNAGAVQDTQNQMPWLILLALLAVYIVLGILYESYVHPLTILSTLPSAGVGALLALMLAGQEIGIVAIIGIILLIGIVKKNAIMMIDFALDAERNEGKPPHEAIYQACLLRFRPILMTTMAALLGALPLMLAGGAGAELRQPLGITMVGGLLLSQVLTLFTTPVIYLYFDRLARRWAAWRKQRGLDLNTEAGFDGDAGR